MRRVGFVCAFIVVLVAAAGAWTESASAYSGGPNSPITDPTNRSAVKALLRDIGTNPSPYGTNTATGSAATAAEVETGLTAARGSALILPRLTTIGIGIFAAAGAGYLGWKIGSPVGGYVYKKITGETYGGSTTGLTIANVRWLCAGTFAGNSCGSTSSSGLYGGGSFPPNWYLNWNGGVPGFSLCGPGVVTCLAPRAVAYTLASSIQAIGGGTWETGTSAAGECLNTTVAPLSACVVLVRSEQQMERAIKVEQSNAAGYAGAAATKDASSWTVPSSTSDAEVESGLAAIGANNSTTGSASEEAAIDAINHAIDSGWSPGDPPPGSGFQPFILPQPLATETYLGYVERLRAQGWLGTLTRTNETVLEGTATAGTMYEAAPLLAPTAITVAGAAVVNVFDPANGNYPTPQWPDNPPHISTAHTAIAIRVKPTASVLPPPSGGGGGGGGDLDFSPLTDLDPGCKFPYGFVCYATTVTGYFDVAPDAPVFDFNVDCPGLADCSGSGGQYEFGPVDLNVMDDYMDMWRTILAFVIWIGAVYLLATRLLGFGAGGDPGEAIDDAWPD